MATKERIYCYVDGYNLYRAIRKFVFGMGHKEQIWCDLIKLAQHFVVGDQTIEKLYYCSAPYRRFRRPNTSGTDKEIAGPNGIAEKIRKTRRAQALFCSYHRKTYGRELFRAKFGYFTKSNQSFEEKQTDVNIALLALDHAHRDYYDHAFIFSSDGDFAPIAEYVFAVNKKITFIFPPERASHSIWNNPKIPTRLINGGHIRESQFDPGAEAPAPDDIY